MKTFKRKKAAVAKSCNVFGQPLAALGKREAASQQKREHRYPVSVPSGVFLVFIAAQLSIGVFILPWHVPLSQPSYSQSYTYGFNNFAAVLWIAGSLAIMVVWQLFFSSPMGCIDAIRHGLSLLMPDSKRECHDPTLFRSFIAMSVFVLLLNVSWLWLTPQAYGTEAASFLSRIDMMVMGFKPYRDFQFSYGPFLLFGPFYLYRLSMGGLSIEQAYAFMLILNWMLGLYSLYYILSRLNGEFARLPIFWLTAFSMVYPSFGLNSTPLRFTISLAIILAFHRVVLKAVNASLELAKVAGAAFLAPLACFALSPEMGLATLLGVVAYCAHLWFTPFRRLSWAAITAMAVLPVVALCFSSEYFNAVLSFSGGGNNFPIYPIPAIIFFLFAVFCVVPGLAILAVRQRNFRGAISLACCMVTGLLIVAALGRADGGHVNANGIGVFLLCVAALSVARMPLFKIVLLAYAVLFVGMSLWNDLDYDKLIVSQAIQLRKTISNPTALIGCRYIAGYAEQSGLRYSKMLPVPSSYEGLLQFPRIGIPLGCDEGLERFLKLHGKIQVEYHMSPYMEVYLKTHLERKLADLQAMEVIIVPADAMKVQTQVDLTLLAKADSQFLSNILKFPVHLTPKNQPLNPYLAVVEEIKARYSVIGSVNQVYLLMQRKTGS